MSESQSADPEMLPLDDVNVCDTCGDAGREDLLAICRRCSDGAEHTYCMRVLLKNVPDGDWLCEECKFAEEAEKQKLELELKNAEAKRKRETEVNLNTQSSNKRYTDRFEVAPDAKRQAVETSTWSPKRSGLPRLSALSRETSFKGLANTTRKLAHHSSFNSHSSADIESTRSVDSQPQSPKGSFFQSNLCNSSSSEPKKIPADDFLLPRQKSLKGNDSLDVKEGLYRNVDKSMSTSCIDAGRCRSREFREAGEKSEDTIGNRQRSDMLSGSKGLPSKKGQNAALTGMLCSSGSNLSSSRNICEDINNGNRLRVAVDAALRKKPSFGKNRRLERSDLPSVSNVDSSCDKAFQNLPSEVAVIRDWPVGLHGEHPNLQTDKQTIEVNGKQFTLTVADAMATSQSIEPEVEFPSGKPAIRNLPVASPSVLSTTSAIPEHEYIWQGDLEVQKGRNLSAMYSGMQAYLSTLASPMVVVEVKKFPVKFSLNELPRLSAWPPQFQDIGAKEDHVALFFFAKDIESYEKYYKPLVDNMIQKDLALKGNLEGVEILIFASNQLPHNYQRWNTFYFLWGVFRGKKENSCNPLKNAPFPSYHASSRMQSQMKVACPLDINDGKVDDDEMVENNPRLVGMIPDLGEEKTTLTIEEQRSSCSHKPE